MTDGGIKLKDDNGMRLNMELGSQLSFKVDGVAQSFKAVLIGLEPQEYLILKIAIPREFHRHIKKDAGLKIRFMSLDSEYGFSTIIVDHITTPYNLIFISYPAKVKNLDSRSRTRVCCYIPTTAQMNEKNIKGTLNDISIDGCKFVIKLPVNLQPKQIMLIDKIRLSFSIMGLDDLQTFEGKVRNTTVDQEKIAMGIEFINLTNDMQNSIAGYVASVAEINSAVQ